MSTALAHRTDPDASHDAAEKLSDTTLIKQAIRELLAEEPRADFQLARAYFNLAAVKEWPQDIQFHSIARRRSEMTRHDHEVRPVLTDEGRELRVPSPFGATATVWELVS